MSKRSGPKSNLNPASNPAITKIREVLGSNLPVISLGTLRSNPDLVLGPVAAPFGFSMQHFQMTKKISTELMTAARPHDAEERKRAIKKFIAERKNDVAKDFGFIMDSLDSYFRTNGIDYQGLRDSLELRETEAQKTQDPVLHQALEVKYQEAVSIYLIGIEMCNVWHAMLTEIVPVIAEISPQNKIILEIDLQQRLFVNLPEATTALIRFFLKQKMNDEHSFERYLTIREKIRWLDQYTPKQIEMIQFELSRGPTDAAAINAMLKRTGKLLMAMYHSAVFLEIFQVQEEQSLKALAIALINHWDTFVKAYSEQLDQYILDCYNDNIQPFFDNMMSLEKHHGFTQDQFWMPLFKEMEAFYEQAPLSLLGNTVLAQPNVKESKIRVSCQALAKKLAENVAPKSTVEQQVIQREVLQEWHRLLKQVLATASDGDAHRDLKEIYFLTLTILKHARELNMLAGNNFAFMMRGLIEKISFQIRDSIKKTQPPVASSPVVEIATQLSSLTMTETAPPVETDNRAAKLESEYQDKSKAAHQKREGEQQARVEQLQREHDAILASREKVLKAQFEDETKEHRKKHAQEFAELVKSLKQQRNNKVKALNQEHATQCEALRRNSEKSKQEKRKTFKDDLQAEIEKLKAKHEADLKLLQQQLQTEEDNALQAEKQAFEVVINKLEADYQARVLGVTSTAQERHQQQLKAQSEVLQQNLRHAQKVFDSPVVAHINVPPKTRFILEALREQGIECWIVGGYVRKALKGAVMANDDIDIIVNAKSEQLPAKIRALMTPTPESRLLKMEDIDFWCEPWTDLEVALLKKDFTINTLISSPAGDVHDVLGHLKDLDAKELQVVGAPAMRFEADPTLMLRMIRFSFSRHKAIPKIAFDAMSEKINLVKNIPLGIYWNNINALLEPPYGFQILEYILQNKLFTHIFPSLPENYAVLLETRFKYLKAFWYMKLNEFSHNPQYFDHFHVLSLFVLLSVLEKGDTQASLKAYVHAFKHDASHTDQNRMYLAMEGLFKDIEIKTDEKTPPTVRLGLVTEYLHFEGAKKYEAEQAQLAQHQPQAAHLPTYQQYQKSQTGFSARGRGGHQAPRGRGAGFQKK